MLKFRILQKRFICLTLQSTMNEMDVALSSSEALVSMRKIINHLEMQVAKLINFYLFKMFKDKGTFL